MSTLAKFFAAQSSQYQEVTLDVESQQLIVSGEHVNQRVSLDNLVITPPMANLPQEIKLPCGGLLVLPKGSELSQLNSRHGGVIDWLEKNKFACLLALLLVPLCFYGIVTKGIPTLAKELTPMVPMSVKQSIDRQVMYVFDELMLKPSELDENTQQHWQQLWQKSLEQLDLQQNSYQVLFRQSPSMGANAFALPGGTIVVTDELLKLLKNNEDAVMAVVFHEIGHVEHQHGMQLIAESLATTVLMTYIFGDMEGIAELYSGSFTSIVQNQFSQQLEKEADSYAVKQLQAFDIPTSALADALLAISADHEKLDKLQQYLSSHPSVESRVKFAQQAQ